MSTQEYKYDQYKAPNSTTRHFNRSLVFVSLTSYGHYVAR